MWGKHRGSLLDRAKATREARKQKRMLEEQQKDLEMLVADISEKLRNEKEKSVQKARNVKMFKGSP